MQLRVTVRVVVHVFHDTKPQDSDASSRGSISQEAFAEVSDESPDAGLLAPFVEGKRILAGSVGVLLNLPVCNICRKASARKASQSALHGLSSKRV